MTEVIGLDNALIDITIHKGDPEFSNYTQKKGDVETIKYDDLRKLDLEKYEKSPGGSVANICRNLCYFGASAGFAGSIGKDERGKDFEKGLGKVENYLVKANEPTGVALTYVDGKDRSFRTYLGAGDKFSVQNLEQKINQGMFNETKLFITSAFVFENEGSNICKAGWESIKTAKNEGIDVMLALGGLSIIEKRKDVLEYIIGIHGADIISLNEEEALLLTGTKDYEKAAKELIRTSKIVAITRGGKGIYLRTKSEEKNIEAEPVKGELNHNGAGDCVASVIAHHHVINMFDVEYTGKKASERAAQIIQMPKSSF